MKSCFVILLSFLLSTYVNASTEGKDYPMCKRLAVKYLENCLRDQVHSDADSCWSESKRVYQTCREDAIDQAHSEAADMRSGASPSQSPPARAETKQHDQEKISEVRKIRGIM